MGIEINNAETERLARKLSELTGESMAQAVAMAVEERLKRIESQREDLIKAKVEEVMKIVHRVGGGGDLTSQDIDRLLYDEHGLPK
jgi:antitoxin VapB